jgi:hypothetical protein
MGADPSEFSSRSIDTSRAIERKVVPNTVVAPYSLIQYLQFTVAQKKKKKKNG